MSKLVFSLLLVSILVLGCAQQSEEVDSKPADSTVFTNKDTGGNVKLARKSSTGRNAVAPDIDTGYSTTDANYNYGYGYGYHDAFLAFADYVRWIDYTVTSVVKLQFGNDPAVARIQAVAQTCWNFTITSPQPIKVEKIDTRSSVGNGTMTQTSANTITVNWAVPSSAKGGLVFSLKSSNQNTYCDQTWNWENNPYSNGYNGYYDDYYYYYPVNPCAYRHQQTSLVVTGTAYACANATAAQANLSQGQAFNEDLSAYVNSYSGYMPYISRQVSGGELLSGRVVNFDGQDWWY